MTGPEALSVQGGSQATTADPTAAVAGSAVASQRRTQLIPFAQLIAIVLGVLAITWNQQQTTDGLRTELRSEVQGVRTEMGELRAEIGELRAEVAENGQRLARIEGFLGIGIPDSSQQ